MSPIGHIPLEILSMIFLHLLPPSDAPENPECVPKVLSQVCRHWRVLVFALPALWASLNITCNQKILHPPLHTIHTHLLHSTTHPLSIVLDTDDPDDPWPAPNPHFPAVLAALVAARNRWRYVSIILVDEATQETLDAIAQGDAPLLQSFSCSIQEYLSLEVPPIPLRAFQGCPQLESLAWFSFQAPLGPRLGNEIWRQLTTLRLEAFLTASDCLTLLKLSPRLSAVDFCGINSPDVTAPRHLLHATLHTLHAGGMDAAALIDALTLPALVDLYLNVRSSRSTQHHAVLPAFLIRSTPPLRTLSLADLRLPEAVLLHTLALVDGLHVLCIDDSDLARVPLAAALIHALHPSPPPAQRPLCPRLGTLRLIHLDAPDGACTAMLRARWGTAARDNEVAGLQEVYIEMEGDEHEHRCDYAEMRALNADGLVGSLARPYCREPPLFIP